MEIKLILGLYVNRIIFNLCSDYTLYFAKYEIDLSAIFHPGISRFQPGTGPGRLRCSYATASTLIATYLLHTVGVKCHGGDHCPSKGSSGRMTLVNQCPLELKVLLYTCSS